MDTNTNTNKPEARKVRGACPECGNGMTTKSQGAWDVCSDCEWLRENG